MYKSCRGITLTSHFFAVAISKWKTAYRKYQILLPAAVTSSVHLFHLWVHCLSCCGFYIVFKFYLVVWYIVRHVASSGSYCWLCGKYLRKFYLPLQSLVLYDTVHTFVIISAIWYSEQSSAPLALCPVPCRLATALFVLQWSYQLWTCNTKCRGLWHSVFAILLPKSCAAFVVDFANYSQNSMLAYCSR